MKKTIYKAIAYEKGNTGRKGKIAFEAIADCMSDAVKKVQIWVWQHEDLYYYTIERKNMIENE